MDQRDWRLDQGIIKLLQRHEGLRLSPYHCTAGALTIGYGRNLDAKGISSMEAELMLRNDINDVQKELDIAFPWWRTLSDNRQRVMIDMGFNLGIQKLRGFTNTINYIRNGAYDMAASGMLKSKWAKQVGSRARTLSEMMRLG